MSEIRPCGLEYMMAAMALTEGLRITEPPYAQAPLLRLGEPARGFRSTLTRHEKRARKAKNKAQRKARRITRQKP